MSRQIKGSQQFFSHEMSKAYKFLRHIKIVSKEEEMFNLFLTFSAADFHWVDLHKLFAGHKAYLGKIVVKTLADIPPNGDSNLYIDEKTDFALRQKVFKDNIDVVNDSFFQRRIMLL